MAVRETIQDLEDMLRACGFRMTGTPIRAIMYGKNGRAPICWDEDLEDGYPAESQLVQIPIAYHGRASSIVVSGTDIIRPRLVVAAEYLAGKCYGCVSQSGGASSSGDIVDRRCLELKYNLYLLDEHIQLLLIQIVTPPKWLAAE
ncbi:hypothetical protein Tco_1361588 [Tanacetum coccineum]